MKWNINKAAFLQGLRLFIKSSWISIVLILLILIMVSQVDQGASLVIHLLDHNPINLLLFIIFVNAFSIVVSHYPTYIQTWNVYKNRLEEGHEDGLEWYLTKYQFFGIGIITYRFSKKKSLVEGISLSLRRILGIVLHLTILYIFFTAFDKFIDSFLQGYSTLIIFFFGVITIVGYLKVEQQVPQLDSDSLQRMVKKATVLFYVILVMVIAVMVSSWLYGWSALSFSLFIILEMLSILGFIYFRNVRLHAKRRFVSAPNRKYRWLSALESPLNLISNHQNYLLMLAIVGWLALVTIFIANANVFWVSPITLIMAIFYIIYGLIIIPIKHYFYYKTTKDAVNPLIRKFFVYATPYLFIAFIGFSYLSGLIGNELHLLTEVNKTEKQIVNESEFLENMNLHFSENTEQRNQYYIASYGGGLKANAWNLLLLDALSQFKGHDILQETVAMSGVSGGALGQAFYAALYKQKSNDHLTSEKSLLIGEGNFLSVDLAYSVGRDLVREMFIGKKHFIHPDRAGKAMTEYSRIIDDFGMDSLGYQQYWKTIVDTKGYFPMLITNSTGIYIQRGIACSVELENFRDAFPSASNILDLLDNKTLTYNGAVSSTNRFPILSPTAKVRGKGHFLDGGYFDNSGMMSLQNLHAYFWDKDHAYGGNKKKVFVQIFNSKSEYLRYLLSDIRDDIKFKESQTGEVQAIINVVTSIELLPRYLESNFRRDDDLEYVRIHLPYRLNMEDVHDFLGGKILDEDKAMVQAILDESNRFVGEVLHKNNTQWDVTEPPLGRLIGIRSINYMKAFVEDGRVFKELDGVVEQ